MVIRRWYYRYDPAFGAIQEKSMGLLHEIQCAVIKEDSDLGPILLKLQLLAARLGSQPLAEWVRHESEGYPNEAELPDYRVLSATYTASFSGSFGAGIQNAPIPPHLIEKFAGESWVHCQMRESIAAVDDLLAQDEKGGGSFHIEAADLILLLQGKVYPGYACNSVTGTVSRSGLAAIRHAVRSRLLELTIQLEESIPEASRVSIGPSDESFSKHSAVATQIAHQIIYGNVTTVATSGDGAHITIAIGERDPQSLAEFLMDKGFPKDDANEIAHLASSEEPESKAEPMGPKVRGWLVENLKKAAGGAWKMGLTVATEVIKESLLSYYGLK
jgi:hypothetical protein